VTQSQAMKLQDEMKQVGMRTFIAKQLNGKRWTWVVVYPNQQGGSTVYETKGQWDKVVPGGTDGSR
jgi:hypothetical protein